MDKFGVDQGMTPEQQKLAAVGCPVCGAKPVRQGNLLFCPKHGSEPFERKSGEDKAEE